MNSLLLLLLKTHIDVNVAEMCPRYQCGYICVIYEK